MDFNIDDIIKSGKKFSDDLSSNVVKIAEDKVIKYGSRVSLTEAESIIFVSENTSVPVPKVFKYFEKDGKNYKKYGV